MAPSKGLTVSAPLAPWAHVRFHGQCAIGVFRSRNLVLQCIGSMELETHSFTLRHDDILAMVCGLHPQEDVPAIFAALQRTLQQHRPDMEFIAEEVLLRLESSGEQCTSVVAKVSNCSTGLCEPPCSSHPM